MFLALVALLIFTLMAEENMSEIKFHVGDITKLGVEVTIVQFP